MSTTGATGNRQDHFADWLRRDPGNAEQERVLWTMSPEERISAMRAGLLTTYQCARWAARRPDEVPLLNGEFEFIAAQTPEAADG